MVELPTDLTNDDLLVETKRLAADERTIVASLVAHLAEIDARHLAVAAGHSLFTYCCQVLLLSEDATCTRTIAARMVRAFPPVLPMLADGRLNLTTLRVLAPHLTPANHAELLAEACGKSKRLVEELVARRFPQTVTTSIRRMSRPRGPAPAPMASESAASSGTADGTATAGAETSGPSAAEAGSASAAAGTADGKQPASAATMGGAEQPSAPRPRAPLAGQRPVTPMAEDVFLIRLAAHRAMVDRLHRAQDLLAHVVARGDVTEVFDRALIALIEDLERKKFARRPRRRAMGAKREHTRTISADVRRAVSARDGERCAYVGPAGRRCDARAFLEFHHLRPYGAGGGETADNIELRCRAHNQYEADVYFAPIREAMRARDSIRPGTDGRETPVRSAAGREGPPLPAS